MTDSIGAITVEDAGNLFDDIDDDGVVGVEEGKGEHEWERDNGKGAVVFDMGALDGWQKLRAAISASTVVIHVLYNWCIQSSCGIERARSNILSITLK